YNDGVLGHYELKKITTSYGGVLEYLYGDHAFYFGSTQLNSRVVSQKKITFSAGEEPSVWNFTYPSYAGAASGTVSVQGPVYNAAVTYNAYDPDSPWKLGTINGFQYEDGSFAEARDWTYQEISSDHWTLLGTDMGTAKGLMPSSVTRHRLGGSILKEEYLYDEAPIYKKYGLPWKVRRYVNGSDSPLNSSTKDYYFAGRPSIEEKYLLSLPYSEKEYFGDGLAGGILIKAKYSDYYEEDGKWGALNHVRLLKPGSESEYNEWTYYYQPGDAQGKTILISVLGPTGSARSTTYNYGVKKKDTLGDTTLLSCTISEYDSSVITASTQDGAVIGLAYDALGRVTQENWPDDRNDRIIEWCPNDENKSITTRGNHTITKFWDGMGRDTGSIESGDGVTLYSRKTLDAEGRVTAQSTGGVDPQHETHFLY
ncbi:MAG: hypothetical protein L0213_12070, partial [Candidatus Dadabacteria bacterium]|nr:hypothetical protein [Candidatus Dadabacteria bacterium]